MAKKIRIGVIGAGAIAQACHIPGYMKSKKCVLVAVADPEKKSLKMLRDQNMIFEHEYSDYREMLAKEKLDFVSVCVPNRYHAECAIAAMKAGADILLEKPMTLTMKEAELVEKTAKQCKRRAMVGFSHRFNDLVIAAKKAVEAGKIGKPYMIRVRFAHTGPIPGWAKTDWFYKPEIAGGGALLDMAVHAFDLVQWVIGPVEEVSAKAVTLRKKIAVDDNVVAWVDFGKKKCLGYVECGWTSPAGFWGVEIMGDKGCIVCDYAQDKAFLTVGAITPDGAVKQKKTILAKTKHPHWVNEMAYVVSKLGSNEPFRVGIADGMSTLQVVLGAYESSKTGKSVKIR